MMEQKLSKVQSTRDWHIETAEYKVWWGAECDYDYSVTCVIHSPIGLYHHYIKYKAIIHTQCAQLSCLLLSFSVALFHE